MSDLSFLATILLAPAIAVAVMATLPLWVVRQDSSRLQVDHDRWSCSLAHPWRRLVLALLTTGLLYFAWPMGPVPIQLNDDFRAPPADMRAAFTIRTAPADDPDSDSRLWILPRITFDGDIFTRRELKEMDRLDVLG